MHQITEMFKCSNNVWYKKNDMIQTSHLTFTWVKCNKMVMKEICRTKIGLKISKERKKKLDFNMWQSCAVIYWICSFSAHLLLMWRSSTLLNHIIFFSFFTQNLKRKRRDKFAWIWIIMVRQTLRSTFFQKWMKTWVCIK